MNSRKPGVVTQEVKIGALVALLCFGVFVLVVLSTVEARGELEDELEVSLQKELSRAPEGDTGPVRCAKRELPLYECVRSVRTAGPHRYRTNLKDDGCWTAVARDIEPEATRERRDTAAAMMVSGCLPD